MEKKMLIGVAGMVGCGKSTLTQALARELGYSTALESIGDENPWLERFYAEEEGMTKFGLNLQLHFLATRMQSMREIRALGGGWVLDRTWYEDAEIFAKGLYKQGFMTDLEFDLYNRLYVELKHSPAAKPPNVLVYLHGPLDVIVSRIQSRGRKAEKDTDFDYWEKLHQRYSRWISEFSDCPVLPLDIRSYDLSNRPDSIRDITLQIEPFIK